MYIIVVIFTILIFKLFPYLYTVKNIFNLFCMSIFKIITMHKNKYYYIKNKLFIKVILDQNILIIYIIIIISLKKLTIHFYLIYF